MAKPGKGSTPLKFGRYNALTKLGQGAMATVYLAEDPALNRMVAIKVIHSHLSSNANLLDRFTVEAKTAAGLRNPNIVEIFDYGLEEGAQYLVMEYIDGPNLQFVLNLLGGQPMEPDACAAVICQAADGLVTAEKFGVVHRDIKPENMMFKSDGVLKIADFGIAHISEQNLTQTGSILGSPNFMSPEQIDGQKPTHMADMFSLGAVFYYCLTGRKPFNGPNIPSIMRHISDMPHDPVSSLVPDVDPILENLVDTLLQKAPEARGNGARWLSLQLRSYLNRKGLLDLTEVTCGFLDRTGKMGNQTVIDLTPAPGPDESLGRGKTPLKPGLKVEKQKAAAGPKPGTGIRPGTSVPPGSSLPGTPIRPGTGIKTPGTGIRTGSQGSSGTGVPPGTWQAGRPQDQDLDFNGPGNGSGHAASGGGGKNLLMWVVAGVVSLGLLVMALFVVLDREPERPVVAAEPKPVVLRVASVSLQPGAMEIQAGQKRRFMVGVQPAGAPQGVRWESANPMVASVVDGEVMAQSAGQTTIRAISLQDTSISGSAEVVVAPEPAIANTDVDKPDPRPKPKPVEPVPDPIPSPEDIAAAGGNQEVKPAPKKSVLTITSAPPFAEVIIDGRFMGTTPVKGRELNPGRHKVQITHRSFPPVDTVVNLPPGESTLRFRLFR